MITLHKKAPFFFLLLLLSFFSFSQKTDSLLQKKWNAFWIAVPNEPAHEYGVYHFRKTMYLSKVPDTFPVHVSADNRYKLLVNGSLLSLGPARGDLYHWNYQTVDLAPHLVKGENVIAAIVWNEGLVKPEAQMSVQTAFILQGASAKEEIINTNKSWKGRRDKSYEPISPQLIYAYYVSGPGEKVDMNQKDDEWMKGAYNETSWPSAQEIFHGLPKGVFDFTYGWMLVPSPIPPMQSEFQRFSKTRKAEGISFPADFPQKKTPVTIPANRTISFLLDQGTLTNAYPTLVFSKGKNAMITMGYAEALYIDEGTGKDWRAQNKKGHRDEVEGKRFVGKEDRVISNGKEGQNFTPLWWRTFRYVQVKVQTGEEPLVLEDIYSYFTGYPFQRKAQFASSNDTLTRILDVGWHTARLCAFETYMDCPYYEQLQYIGDARIQALVSLYNSGDDRLMRNAISQLDHSRMAEGITLSRYPTATAQQIPPFSLWWIGTLHDYWRYRPDAAFVKEKLPGTRQVLQFFSQYQQADGSLKNLPYWNFSDWAEDTGWHGGVAPIGKEGYSAILDLQLLWAYQLAAGLETTMGMQAYADLYGKAASLLKSTIRKKYWNSTRGLFADTPEKDLYSQHVNALAILTGVVTGDEAKSIGWKLTSDATLTAATIYFKYYINQALIKAGFGNDYLNWLDIWKENLKMGMTTWAEISDINAARSDCHAWGSHPNIEFFRTVLGIDTDAPGFSRVKIEPHLGALKTVSGEIPHPKGVIAVAYQKGNNNWAISISLPPNTPGYLVWKGKQYALKSGEKNKLALP